MTGIVHRYLRRLVRWAQTPSDEDMALREASRIAAETALDRRAIENLIKGRNYALSKAFVGLSKAQVLSRIEMAIDIWRSSEPGAISPLQLATACDQICEANGLCLVDIVNTHKVPWPVQMSRGNAAA